MRNSMKQQRRFTKEFEDEAVRLAATSGRTQREIAGDLGIGLSTLVRWISRDRDRRAADPNLRPGRGDAAGIRDRRAVVQNCVGKRYPPPATAIEERGDGIVSAGFGDRHAG